jgi:hypothetical protein
MVHSLKPNPKSHIQEGWRIADFFSHHPEAMHMVGAGGGLGGWAGWVAGCIRGLHTQGAASAVYRLQLPHMCTHTHIVAPQPIKCTIYKSPPLSAYSSPS